MGHCCYQPGASRSVLLGMYLEVTGATLPHGMAVDVGLSAAAGGLLCLFVAGVLACF